MRIQKPLLAALALSLTLIVCAATRLRSSGLAIEGAGRVFGDSVPDLSGSERAQFDAGYQLFIKVWKLSEGQQRSLNGNTCVACHMEPMPGGSGTASRTFVLISKRSTDAAGGHVFKRFIVNSTEEIPQRVPQQHTNRKTPSLFGLGLLEAVQAQDMVAVATGTASLGWRGKTMSLYDFVEKAIAVELGLQTPRFHQVVNERRSTSTTPDQHLDVSVAQIQLMTQFIRLLGPPRPKNAEYMSLPGARIFEQLGCSTCHTAVLVTGNSEIQALRYKTISPFTDLRTHDMGPELSDCEDESPPRCSRFRTSPLWGLSSTGPPFLHDGRAETLERAIIAHGGEAQTSRNAYLALNYADRELLQNFLNSL